MRKVTEAILQKAALDWLSTIPGIYFFRSGAGMVKTEEGRVFKTGKPGCPDITVCKDGRFLGLEIKTPTGRQSATQKLAQLQIEEAGGEYHIIKSIDELKAIL